MRYRILLLIFLTFSFAGIVAPQVLGPDTVFVNVTVTGAKGQKTPALNASNFRILEDGVEQKITAFMAPDGVWDINLILANSQLGPGRADAMSLTIRDAVEMFKSVSNPRDRIKVEELSFGSDGLYAAIDENLVDLQRTNNPRRALVVVTDGYDRPYSTGGGSVADLSEFADNNAPEKLLEFARKLNIPIYFIYSFQDLGQTALSNMQLKDKDLLTSIADATGGSLESVDTYTGLVPQVKRLAESLRNKYLLGFTSTNDRRDNKWRSLKLIFTAPEGYKLNATMKKKYFAPKPSN